MLRVTLAVLALLALAAPAQAADPQPPSQDPFYAPPAGWQDAKPGDVLRSRPVDVTLGKTPATPLAVAYQLLYRTNDAREQPVTTVTTLLIPRTPASDRALLSVQDAEDSADDQCAPSYQLQTKGPGYSGPENGNLTDEGQLAVSELNAGRAILFPDHDGPRSEFLVSGLEGRATLDSIRAAERFAPGGLNAKTKVAMIGYSGGGHATAAANELQHAYAPELNVVGVAAGGVPVGDRASLDYDDGGDSTGVIFGVAISLDRAFPGFDLQSLLNDRGKELVAQAQKGCATSLSLGAGERASAFTTVPDFLGVPRVKRALEANALGHAGVPAAPSFYYHAAHDELVWVKPVDALIAGYCADGAPIEYDRDEQGQSHTEGIPVFAAQGVRFVEQRFAGAAFSSNCSAQRDPATGRAACTSRRTIAVHPRITRRAHVRRIRVYVDGRRVRTVSGRARRVTVALRGHAAGTVRVTLAIDRRGRRAAHDRRTYHLCARAS